MSDQLPSRERFDLDELADDVRDVSHLAGDIVQAYASGRLVDREAIDWDGGADWWIDESRMLGYTTDRHTGRVKAHQFLEALGVFDE